MIIEPTPKQHELIAAALSGRYTMILFGGAVGGAKTAGLFLLFLIAQRVCPGIQVCFVRKDYATIERNSYATWNEITEKFGKPAGIKQDRRGNSKNPSILMQNGSALNFFGENFDKDKELTRWSGLIPNWFFADEINELQEKSYRKMFERAGRYQLKSGLDPGPLIVATCNPSQGWVKREIYDKWKEGTLPDHVLYIPSKITDNPHLSPAYVSNLQKLPLYERQVFVEGNWDVKLKTGGEFLKNFEHDKHVRPAFRDNEPIMVSIDNNLLPYVSVTIWVITKDEGKYTVKQVHEIIAEPPFNSAPKAGQLLNSYLSSIEYNDTVRIFGDPSTQNRSTIDENNRSFLDLFVSKINYRTEVKMSKSNKSVSNMGAFINAILAREIEDIEIQIHEQCTTSINDYIQTKEDAGGGILKKRITNSETKQTYEEHGHLTDTFKDFICQAFPEHFRKYIDKPKRLRLIMR